VERFIAIIEHCWYR